MLQRKLEMTLRCIINLPRLVFNSGRDGYQKLYTYIKPEAAVAFKNGEIKATLGRFMKNIIFVSLL